MSKQTFGKFKRIFRTYGIQLSGGVAILWGVVKLVGTPSENYRRLEVSVNYLMINEGKNNQLLKII